MEKSPKMMAAINNISNTEKGKIENTAPITVERLLYMLSEKVVAKTVLQRYIMLKIIRNPARILIMIMYFL